jgi:hypothetical protein
MNTPTLAWKPDWEQCRQAHIDWWNHKGLALSITALRKEPWEKFPPAPERSPDPDIWWRDPIGWVDGAIRGLAGTYWGGAAFPDLNTNIGGPGSLGLFLGSIGHPAPTTMWYEPIITDPDNHPPLRFSTRYKDWDIHMAMLREAVRLNRGRYTIGFPDLIENVDVLAQLRDPQLLLMDMIERPDWVKARVEEINTAFFDCYDRMWKIIKDPWGGSAWSAFQLWGPGRVAKVQCDFCCMISQEMFGEFVVPSLTEQCARLDYSMYHLDGTTAVHHLDALLAIEPLDAIEWTPQSSLPGGGSPQWYDIYRRIKKAGKSVQAIGVKIDEIEPLLDAVGPEGMYIMSWHDNEDEARAMLRKCGYKGES